MKMERELEGEVNKFMRGINYKNIFRKYPEIVSACLFGSRARGDFSPISDFDYAVQVSGKLERRKYTDLKLDLIKELCGALKSDDVDIVILNDAPILLKHRILRDRKILFCRSHLERVRFEAKILTEYLDEKEYETAFAKGVFARILGAA